MQNNKQILNSYQDEIKWDIDGLIPVIAQDAISGEVLMLAWMNREALAITLAEGYAVYWSRSRRRLWRKGEESGHTQRIIDLRLDCDNDVMLIKVEQMGEIACHTGHRSCFFRRWDGGSWIEADPILKDPRIIYHR